MPRKVTVLAVLCILGGPVVSFTTSTCWAQRVRVSRGGGVHVRAPFVRVDVDPYGGVSVRAPFTAVDTRGRPYHPAPPPVVLERRIERPTLPTASELAALDDEALLRTLRSNADRLHEHLGRFDTGATWHRYLRLPEEVLADNSAGLTERREAAAKLLERFRHVTTERQYAMIAQLPAFAATEAALTELVSRLDQSPAASGTPSEELPMPQPDRPGNKRSLLDPDSGLQ